MYDREERVRHGSEVAPECMPSAEQQDVGKKNDEGKSWLFFLSLRILVLFKKHKQRFLNLAEGRIALFCVDVDHTW